MRGGRESLCEEERGNICIWKRREEKDEGGREGESRQGGERK